MKSNSVNTCLGLKAIIALLSFLFLSSCVSGGSVEYMLSPPKLSDEQVRINAALVNSRGQDFVLKYPKSGDYISAFLIEDFDGDIDKEAIVFYEMSGIGAERIILMNFLDKDEAGNWESVYELPIRGTEIERVYFTPLGDSELINIIVCYSLNQAEKAFMLIRYADRTPRLVFEDAYSFADVADYFDEGQNNLLIIKNDRAREAFIATIYIWQQDVFSYYSGVPLDPTAGEYVGLVYGKVNQNTDAIIIEHRKSHDSDYYGTDMIYRSGNRLLNAVYNERLPLNSEKTARRVNLYTEYAAPTDINGDGFIELCGTTEFFGYEGRPTGEKMFMTTWKSFEFGALKELYATYYTRQNGYAFIIPNRWKTGVTPQLFDNNTGVSFTAPDGDELLAIKTVPFDADFSGKGYVLLKENQERRLKYYARRNTEAYSLTITEKELQESLLIVDS